MPKESSIPSATEALIDPERALRAATLFLSAARGFHLCTALYGNPNRRNFWISRLADALAEKETRLSVLHYQPGQHTRLLHAVRDHLRKLPPLEDGYHYAITVTDFDVLLPDAAAPTGPERPTHPLLAGINLDRELFLRDCPVPLLLWLTPPATTAVARQAPDLWQWLAHTFDFEERSTVPADGIIRSISTFENDSPGTIYRNREELVRARTIFAEGVAAATQAYGDAHKRTREARSNLANVLRQLGDPNAALELVDKNWKAIEDLDKVDERELARCLNERSILLLATNQMAEAEPLMRRALQVFEDSLSAEHPDIIILRKNLEILEANLSNRQDKPPLNP